MSSHERICGVCGNTLNESGVCLNCLKNAYQHDKKWRYGDRTATRVVKGGDGRSLRRRPTDKRRDDEIGLAKVISGTWRSTRHEVQVIIDTGENSYISSHPRRPHPQRRSLRVTCVSPQQLRLMTDGIAIDVGLLGNGLLLFRSAGYELCFAGQDKQGRPLRLCPVCFRRNPIRLDTCRRCGYAFEAIDETSEVSGNL